MSGGLVPMPLGGFGEGGGRDGQEDAAFRSADSRSGLAALAALLLERKWTILLAVVAAAAVAAVVTTQLRPRYLGEAVVVVGARTPQVIELEPVVSGLTINPLSAQAQVETEMQVVRSRGLAERTIAKLGLARDPEFNPRLRHEPWAAALPPWVPTPLREAVAFLEALRWGPSGPRPEEDANTVREEFGRRIGVQAVGRSTALSITASSESPEKAALIANTVAELYLESAVAEKSAATERAAASLAERLRELRSRAAASERAMEEYRALHGLVDVDELGGTSQQLAEIRSQIAVAQAAAAQAGARLAQIRNGGPGAVASSADVLSSPTIQKLREQEVALEHEAQGMMTRLGPRHPEALRQQAAVEAVRQRLRAETAKIAAALEAEVQIQQARQRTLRQNLAAIERDAAVRREAQVGLRELKREADSDRTLYELFLRRHQEVTQQIGMQQPDGVLISRAVPAIKPFWPPRSLYVAIAALIAAVVVSFLIVLREMLRGGLRHPGDVRETLRLPTIGLVPRLSALERLRAAPADQPLDHPGSSYSEAIQLLRLMLRGGAARVVLFTSSVGQEGKTSTAVACARLAARAGEKVVIVDCDFRRSTIERALGASAAAASGPAPRGLADVLTGRCALEDALATDARTGLSYIVSRPVEGALPADLLGGAAMRALVQTLADTHDLVVLDAPPVLPVADALALARLADTTLLVVRAGATPRRLARAAADRLMQAGISVGGVILSQMKGRDAYQDSYGPRGTGIAGILPGRG